MTSSVDTTQFLVLSAANTDGNVQVNGLVVVPLEENASTGYTWRYELPTGTPGALELLNDTVVPGRDAPGAPSAHVFIFGAVKAGATGVLFRNYPPGEGTPQEEFQCAIEILSDN